MDCVRRDMQALRIIPEDAQDRTFWKSRIRAADRTYWEKTKKKTKKNECKRSFSFDLYSTYHVFQHFRRCVFVNAWHKVTGA